MLNTDEVAPLSLDPDRLTIIQLANAEQQISLPWFPKPVTIGTMFHSKLSGTPNPFGHPHESPFDTESLENSKLVYHADSAESTFRAVETKTKLTTKDHLGLSLGVTVGNSFLNANVTGRYDKEVRENTDVCKNPVFPNKLL